MASKEERQAQLQVRLYKGAQYAPTPLRNNEYIANETYHTGRIFQSN
jgi:hypothetical protein